MYSGSRSSKGSAAAWPTREMPRVGGMNDVSRDSPEHQRVRVDRAEHPARSRGGWRTTVARSRRCTDPCVVSGIERLLVASDDTAGSRRPASVTSTWRAARHYVAIVRASGRKTRPACWAPEAMRSLSRAAGLGGRSVERRPEAREGTDGSRQAQPPCSVSTDPRGARVLRNRNVLRSAAGVRPSASRSKMPPGRGNLISHSRTLFAAVSTPARAAALRARSGSRRRAPRGARLGAGDDRS